MLLLWALKAQSLISRIRRRLVGKKPPHWFKDIGTALKALKLLAYVPTAIAIATEPLHFFRRVPIIVRNVQTPYLSPIGFLVGGITIVVASEYVALSYLLAYNFFLEAILDSSTCSLAPMTAVRKALDLWPISQA